MIDAFFRLLYFFGYRCARFVWRFTSPANNGVLVAVWYDGRVLLVQNSYRDEWTFPGGGIDANESPSSAAVREVREELGLIFSEDDLAAAGALSLVYHHRRDHVTFFHAELSSEPGFSIDNREIVSTVFRSPEDALASNLTPHVRKFLQNRPLK